MLSGRLRNQFLVIGFFTLVTFLTASCNNQEEKKPDTPVVDNSNITALTGVTVIDGSGNSPMKDVALLLDGDKIKAIVKSTQVPEGCKVIDCQGKYVIPGLIDMHAHVTILPLDSNGGLARHYDREASIESLKTLLSYGITAVRNPAAPTEDGIELKRLVRSGKVIGPEICTAGLGLNRVSGNFGPFAATPTEEQVREEVQSQVEEGVDIIKVYASLAPNLIKVAIDEAHKSHTQVVGHLQNTTWTEAAEMGIDFICHAAPWSVDYLPENLRAGYRPTFLGRLFWLENVDYDGPEIQEMLHALKNNDVTMDPTLSAFRTKFWGDDSMYVHHPKLSLAPKTVREVWKKATFTSDWTEEDYARAKQQWGKLLELTKRMYDEGIRITAGSDYPNPWVLPGLSMHWEMQFLSEAGIPNNQVIKIATYNAAESLGVLEKVGTLEPGKLANLVVLDANPLDDISNTQRIAFVMKDGVRIGR